MPVTSRDHGDGYGATAADGVESAATAAANTAVRERTNFTEAVTKYLLIRARNVDTGDGRR